MKYRKLRIAWSVAWSVGKTMAKQIQHDLGTLRMMLERLAQLDHEHEGMSQQKTAALYLAFRDCQLELFRLMPSEISDIQKHRLGQMEARLNLVAKYGALPDSIGPEARRALDSFGWFNDQPTANS